MKYPHRDWKRKYDQYIEACFLRWAFPQYGAFTTAVVFCGSADEYCLKTLYNSQAVSCNVYAGQRDTPPKKFRSP